MISPRCLVVSTTSPAATADPARLEPEPRATIGTP